MPSNIPSYVYSLFATLIIGTIIVSSCSISMANVKNKADTQQLTNIGRYVATQSLILCASMGTNQNSTQQLDIPTQVGNKQYWVSIANDSSGAWVQTGLGTSINSGQKRVRIPAEITASGLFISGYGRPYLKCTSKNQTVTLILTGD
jgi:hypothetical protein